MQLLQELGIQPSVSVLPLPKIIEQKFTPPSELVSKQALDALSDQGIDLSDILQMQQQIMEGKIVLNDSGDVKVARKRTMYVNS